MGAPCGPRDTALPSGRATRPQWQPLTRVEAARFSPALPALRSRPAWLSVFCGIATPAGPDRRGSRDSGQTANMVLAGSDETRPPEQRVRRALQCADYWAAATAFNQPAT